MFTSASRRILLFLCIAVATAVADTTAQPRAGGTTLSFNGDEFIHRWSKNAQHEFTPKGDEDLTKWGSMLTVNVHEWARTGDQLAELANKVLGNYQQAGKVIRTDSKPRTEKNEAEHFAVALLPGQAFIEAAFARFLIHDGRGVVVVYSKRFYGDKSRNEMGEWLKKNGSAMESALMSWTGMPSQTALKALPNQ
jgi:hypothetical protein